MNNFTNLFRNTIVLLCLLVSSSTFSQTIIGGPYDFETTNEGWTLSGGNALRTNNNTFAYSNNYSIQLRSTGGSAMTSPSPGYSFSAYDKIDLKFFFSSYDMEATENFTIEYKPSLVGAWTTIATFVANDITSPNQGDFLRDDYSKAKYTKTVTLLKTNYSFPLLPEAQFRITCVANQTTDRVYIDYVTVIGTTFATPTNGPGGITSNLDLWLRGDKLDGSTVGTDGANISKWTDSGKGNHAETVVAGTEPVYRNNSTDNFNFNPVIEFENDYNTAGRDLKYINTRDELSSTDGFNSNDIFIVLVPDYPINNTMYPMDTFTGHDPTEATYSEDVTGIGFGDYSQRFTGEYFAYAQGTSSGVGIGYGRADTSGTTDFTQIGIYNARHNTSNSSVELFLNANSVCNTDSDIPDFTAVNDSKYWLGRSQHFNGSFGGRIAEIITYDSRKTDGVTERSRIESYLALKYGLTLGTNGTSQNYVDSNGNTVWDATVNAGYNYDIAGIFRDDASNHSQKQSKSENETSDGTGLLTGILTMGLTDINTTNSANTNTFGVDRQYLVWGNNGTSITSAPFTVNVDMSAGIGGLSTPVTFDGMQRIWKVVETGGDVPSVKVSIPQDAVRNISPPGSYLMFISDTNVFDPTADYRVMIPDGSGNLQADYDFDGTKYITFGYAPEVIVERSIQFDGVQDYIDVGDHKDLNSSFTVSAWIKRTSGLNDVSILSKRDASFTEGYDFLIESGDRVEMIWNGGSDNIRGNTTIPQDEWHHVSVIYSGGTANLYIDGVLDKTETGLSNPNPAGTTQSFIIAAAGKTSTTDFFEGNIDEVRIWDVALSEDQLHYIMNQEMIDNSGFASGNILPTTITKNEVSTIPWSDLAGYYPMSVYTYTNTNDHSDNSNQGALRNLDTVDWQTAPLPYESQAVGSWDADATWLNNTVQTLPNALSIVDGTTPIDWNIVEINNNVYLGSSPTAVRSRDCSVQGLLINSSDVQVNGDTSTNDGIGLTVTHYLDLNGSIDLEGESQLVQTDGSVLVVGGSGDLERDQQGTADTFTYNYWSSPVGDVNITANNATYKSRFTVPDILSDGTNPAIPAAISFLSSGYDGTSSPFGIADYWIWKFADLEDGNYSLWQHMRSTGNILPGEGFTMKGPGTGTITTPQNYVFNGKPNNGDIIFTIGADNDYLVGNPYPSAINAHTFLNDNIHTNGTLYFWEHWGGGSHNLGDYQGGYALLNFSGATPTPSYATSDADVNQTGSGTKLPGQYIPVGQGFFVYSAGGGTMRFENDQRVFQKEGATSTFMRTNSETTSQPTDYNEDGRMKFRIGFDSFNGIHRQLLLTVDENASLGVDWGYDGKHNGNQIDDMYWMIDNEKFAIQGTNAVTAETIAPLGLHVRDNGINHITIDHLENVPDDVEIYAYDNELNIYHDLRQSDYEVNLSAGSYLDRFAIVFTNPNAIALSNDEFETSSAFEAFYSSDDKNLVIHNPNLITIDSLELLNILGQSIYYSNEIETQNNTSVKVLNLSSGTYIINLNTESGKISKKVLVN